MPIFDYFQYYLKTCLPGGEGGPKILKMWLRNIWMVPNRDTSPLDLSIMALGAVKTS